MNDNPLSLLVRYGVSDTLVGMLQAVAESEGLQGPRYSQQTARELNRMILCRNQNKALWRLAHLLAAVESTQAATHGPNASVGFFWVDENISAQRVRSVFAQPATAPGVSVHCTTELHIVYADGDFVLAPSAVPLLCALLELAVAVVPDIWSRLQTLGEAPTKASVAEFAGYLQTSMHAYLQAHLQPLQQQRKGRGIIEWLATRQSRQVNDAAVLAYWQYALVEDQADFRLFNSAAEAFLSLQTVSITGAAAVGIAQASTLGADSDGGEIDPERLESECAELEALASPLSQLQGPPLNEIKFLTDADLKSLAFLDCEAGTCQKLPLTLARMAVFGAVQISISQYLRRGAQADADRLVSDGPALDYAACIAALADMLAKIDTTQQCIAHMLIEARHPAGGQVLLDALDDQTRSAISERLSASLDGAVSAADQLFGLLPEMTLQLPALNTHLRALKAAYKSVNRHGFKSIPDDLGPYVEGDAVLRALTRHIRGYLQALQSCLAVPGVDDVFAADRLVFQTSFREIYGGAE